MIMKDLYKKALESYIEMLSIHIDTKTSDTVFHKETEEFYETLFNIAHKVWERFVDLWWKLIDTSLEEKKKRVNQIIVSLKKDIEDFETNNKVSLWTQDLLWTLADDLENIEWSSKAFLNK